MTLCGVPGRNVQYSAKIQTSLVRITYWPPLCVCVWGGEGGGHNLSEIAHSGGSRWRVKMCLFSRKMDLSDSIIAITGVRGNFSTLVLVSQPFNESVCNLELEWKVDSNSASMNYINASCMYLISGSITEYSPHYTTQLLQTWIVVCLVVVFLTVKK